MNNLSRKLIFNLLFSGLTFYTFMTADLSWGQTPTPNYPARSRIGTKSHNSQNVTPGQRDWLGELSGCGFPNGVPGDFNKLAFNKELNLTQEQETKIKDLKAKCIELGQREALNDPGSHPWDPKDEKKFMVDCEDRAHELYLSLGEEKYQDFIQWVGEQNEMWREVNILIYDKKEDLSDTNKYTEKLFNEFINFKTYQTYKEKKIARINSNVATENFFSKHEKALKLRIQYALWYLTPVKQESPKTKPRKDTKLGKDILNQFDKVF